MRILLMTFAALALPATIASAAPSAAPAVKQSTQAAFDQAIADFAKSGGGTLGFAARHLESGEEIVVNGDTRFPMASTMKVAIAALILKKVDQGEVTLEQMMTVEPGFMERSGPIADSVSHPGVILSVANLLELMLTKSNNTATDMLVELAGGPQAATAWLRSLGVEGQRIDHDTQSLLQKFYQLPADKPVLPAFMEVVEKNPSFADKIYQPNPAFDADPEDSSTPRAMNDLLTRIFSGKVLTAKSTSFLRGVMERCATGEKRLKGMLPADTIVAHKTGTLGGSVNDVGVITLPGNRGHVVVSAFLKSSNAPQEAREKAIAEAGRAAYDYFLFR